MAAAAQQQAALVGLGMGVSGLNLGLGSPGLGAMPNGLNMAQLAQLNGMNTFNMNMHGLANLNATGIYYQRCNSSRRRSPLVVVGSDSRALLSVV